MNKNELKLMLEVEKEFLEKNKKELKIFETLEKITDDYVNYNNYSDIEEIQILMDYLYDVIIPLKESCKTSNDIIQTLIEEIESND